MFACLSFAHSLLCGLPALLFAAFLLCRGAAAPLWTCCEGLRLRGVGQPFGQGAELRLSSCDGKEAGSLVEGPRNTKGWDLVGMGFWWGKEGLGFSSQPTSEGVSLQGHVGLAPAGALGYNSCEWLIPGGWRSGELLHSLPHRFSTLLSLLLKELRGLPCLLPLSLPAY